MCKRASASAAHPQAVGEHEARVRPEAAVAEVEAPQPDVERERVAKRASARGLEAVPRERERCERRVGGEAARERLGAVGADLWRFEWGGRGDERAQGSLRAHFKRAHVGIAGEDRGKMGLRAACRPTQTARTHPVPRQVELPQRAPARLEQRAKRGGRSVAQLVARERQRAQARAAAAAAGGGRVQSSGDLAAAGVGDGAAVEAELLEKLVRRLSRV